MRKFAAKTTIIATLVMLTSSGCSQIQTVFRSPGSGAPASTPTVTSRSDNSANAREQAPTTAPRARLASYQQPQPRSVTPDDASKNQPTHTRPTNVASNENRFHNIGTNGAPIETSDSAKNGNSQQVASSRFTAPSPGFRQLGAATSLAAFATTTTGDQSAQLASQSSVSVGGATIGGAGLAAPSPSVSGVVASNPGIQSGPATGLSFAGPSTIFNRQVNLASGPNGACNTLIRAGFTNSHTACQTQRVRR